MNKLSKTMAIIFIKKYLIYMFGDETANHVNFIQPMLISYVSCSFSPLEVDIRKVSKI